jgi:hypothetical protein
MHPGRMLVPWAAAPLLGCVPSKHVSAPQSLAGRWQAEFVVEESLRVPEALGRRAEGTIWLRESRDTSHTAPIPAGLFSGPFNIDFRPLGHPGLIGTTDSIVPTDACQAGTGAVTAVGRQVDADSVAITMGQCVGHGYVLLNGRRTGPTIKGVWAIISAGGAKGHFAMSRTP